MMFVDTDLHCASDSDEIDLEYPHTSWVQTLQDEHGNAFQSRGRTTYVVCKQRKGKGDSKGKGRDGKGRGRGAGRPTGRGRNPTPPAPKRKPTTVPRISEAVVDGVYFEMMWVDTDLPCASDSDDIDMEYPDRTWHHETSRSWC
eukprot:413576-Amphidinium_carterae.1